MGNVYKESFRLIGGSGKETCVYLVASLAASGLYVAMCAGLGLGGGYDSHAVIKDTPFRALIAFLPGIVVSAWFAAGLAGRFTIDAMGGTPEAMERYARGWFLRKLGGDSLVMVAVWVPVLLLIVSSFASVVAAVGWMIVAFWLGFRVVLWFNISVVEELGLIDAMRRSYAMTSGQVLRLLLLGGAPMLTARFLGWTAGTLLPGQMALVFYIKSVLDGAALVVIMGVVAAIYRELRSAPPVEVAVQP
jgi:hypothetical protein